MYVCEFFKWLKFFIAEPVYINLISYFLSLYFVKAKSKKRPHTSDEQLMTEFYINEKQCEKKCIQCPAGSIVLFDSRIIHYGQPALPRRIQPNFRCVAYICMLPRFLCSRDELEKKRGAFQSMQTTHHSPTKIKHFSSNPKFFDNNMQVQSLPRPNVSALGMKLAGF